MIRPSTLLLVAGGLALATAPGLAETIPASGHAKPVARHGKAAKPKPSPAAGSTARGINAPSTDFSTVERADEEPRSPDGPSLRPAMGSGGMGLGGSF